MKIKLELRVLKNIFKDKIVVIWNMYYFIEIKKIIKMFFCFD